MKKVYKLIEEEKPDVVIQIGDLVDQYVFSHFTKNPKITPKHDVSRGLKCATQMWERIQKIVPNAMCYQVLGNHDVRVTKRIAEKIPELSEFFSLTSMYKFKNVTVLKSDRDVLIIDGVVYCHGWLGQSLAHAKYFNKPTVHGHRHKPAIETEGSLWSMDVGYLANNNSLPLGYTAVRYTKWRAACGIVHNRTPRLILL